MVGEWTGQPFDPKADFLPSELASSADGTRVAFGNRSRMSRGSGRVWVVSFGTAPVAKEIEVLQQAAVWAALSPDGTTLATGGGHASEEVGKEDDRSCEYVQVWDVASGREKFKIRTSGALTAAGVFSPDGRRLLTTDRVQRVEVWGVADGKWVSGVRGRLVDTRWVDWRFSADGRSVCGMADDGTIRVWATDTGDHTADHRPPPVPNSAGRFYGSSMAYNPLGRLVGTGKWGSVALAWDAERRELLTEARGIPDPLTRLAYAPDGRTIHLTGHGLDLLACRADGMGEPEAVPLAPLPEMMHNPLGGYCAFSEFSPDGRRVVVGQPPPTGGAVIYDLVTRAAVLRIPPGTEEALNPVWSPDGRWLAFGGAYGHVSDPGAGHPIRLVDTRTGATRPIGLRVKGVTLCRFTPDSSTLVVEHYVPRAPRPGGGIENRVIGWDLATDRAVADVTYTGQPGGRLLGSGSAAKVVLMGFDRKDRYELVAWDATTGRSGARASVPFTNRTCAAVADRHGRVAIAGLTTAGAPVLVLWNGSDRPPVELPTGHASPIRALAFSPDGTTLVSGGEDTTIVFRPVPPAAR
jgi:WD40 repeat protein